MVLFVAVCSCKSVIFIGADICEIYEFYRLIVAGCETLQLLKNIPLIKIILITMQHSIYYLTATSNKVTAAAAQRAADMHRKINQTTQRNRVVLGGCHAEHHTTPPPMLCARCPQHGLPASPLPPPLACVCFTI